MSGAQSSAADASSSHVHRLVQNEKAKTILLNVPLEVNTSGEGKTSRRSSNNSSPRDKERNKMAVTICKTPVKKKGQRVRSASVGRDKRTDLQARYWAFLFENLRRAVDDLYHTCESDESILAAKEVRLVLENYVKDFRNLIDWLRLKWEYENTPPPQRPTSLAWEVRKTTCSLSSPSTTAAQSAKLVPLFSQRLLMASPARRALHFDDGGKKEPLETHTESLKELDVTPVEDNKAGDANLTTTEVSNKSQNLEETSQTTPYMSRDSLIGGSTKKLDAKNSDAEKTCRSDGAAEEDTGITLLSSESSKDEEKGHAVTDAEQKQEGPKPPENEAQVSNCRESSTGETTTRTEKSASVSGALKDVSNESTGRPERKTVLSTRSHGSAQATEKSNDVIKKGTMNSSLSARNKIQAKSTTTSSQRAVSLAKENVSRLNSRRNPSCRAESSTSQRGGHFRNTRTRYVGDSEGGAQTSSVKTQRMSLVARQGMTSQQGKQSSVIRAQQSTVVAKSQGTASSIKGPVATQAGSTSSVNSTGSSRSWAETVKGLSAPRSVENLSLNVVSKTCLDSSGNQATSSKNGEAVDDEGGWETVRPRTRSKISPSNQDRARKRISGSTAGGSTTSKPLLRKRDSLDTGLRKVNHSHKTRFQMPSSAMSLPSLALMKEEEDVEDKSVASQGDTQSQLGNVADRDERRNNSKVKQAVEKSKSRLPTKPSSRAALEEDKSEQMDKDDDGTDNAIAQNEVAIAKAQEEEDKLAQEIRDTEKEELLSENEAEADYEKKEDEEERAKKVALLYEKMMETRSWAEQVDFEEQIVESRYPGRVIELHEKLSSPARKKEPEEAFRMHQEKQNQARIRRQKFQDEKASKLSALNSKIEEVIAQKEMLMNERRDLLSDKMRKAEEKRQQYIEGIRRKAHEEEAKLKEIAFINELQAQNSRIDMIAHTQTVDEKHEERLAELAEERARKVEERASKEARAEQKRKEIERKRQKDMQALRERIRSREERIQEEQEQARKDREEAAREKARDREEKLSSIRAAEEDLKTELQEKIQQKQEDAAKRHREKLQRIRNKAFESSVQRCSTDEGVPNLQEYNPKKKCDICQVLITNEVHLQSHLRGKAHCERLSQANNGKKLSGEEIQVCNLKYIVDADTKSLDHDPKVARDKERSKAMKKKAKKIKSRMAQKATEYLNSPSLKASKLDGPNKAKIGKSLKDIEKAFGTQGRGTWHNLAVSCLERSLGEIHRSLSKADHTEVDQTTFYALNGFSTLGKVYGLLLEQKTSCVIPLKSIVTCSKTFSSACSGHKFNNEFVLKSNHLMTLVDILADRLLLLCPDNDKDDESDCPLTQGPQTDPVAKAVMQLLAQCFEDITTILKKEGKPIDQSRPEDLCVRVQDQISYVVNVGIIDMLAKYLGGIQNPIDSDPELGYFLLTCLKFMSTLANAAEVLIKPKPGSPADPTNLLQAYQVTDIAGIVSMLYGILLHQRASSRRHGEPPSCLPSHTLNVTIEAATILLHLVRQHLKMVQDVLGQEGISLEFRHIASHLLWYCQYHKETELLHLILVLIGYFAAGNPDNQAIIQSGHRPSVLQRLCVLPIPYFSQPELKEVLFPTLIAVCHNNKENYDILTEEVSYDLLEAYMSSNEGNVNHLLQIIRAE